MSAAETGARLHLHHAETPAEPLLSDELRLAVNGTSSPLGKLTGEIYDAWDAAERANDERALAWTDWFHEKLCVARMAIDGEEFDRELPPRPAIVTGAAPALADALMFLTGAVSEFLVEVAEDEGDPWAERPTQDIHKNDHPLQIGLEKARAALASLSNTAPLTSAEIRAIEDAASGDEQTALVMRLRGVSREAAEAVLRAWGRGAGE